MKKEPYVVPENYERMAKEWDDKLPNLASALRSESLHKKIDKIKNKPLSRRDKIISTLALTPDEKYSCSDLTKLFIKRDKLTGTVAHYLSGSISSILAKLVKDGILKYADEETERGGHLYQFNDTEENG